MFEPNTSIMVIDMQRLWMDDKAHADIGRKIAYQRGIIDKAKASDIPIVLLEYKDMGPTLLGLGVKEPDIRITKPHMDGFRDTTLRQELEDAGIESIHILGCNAKECVYETVMTGNELGYEMIVHRDGILSKRSNDIRMKEALSMFEVYGIRIV